MTDYEVYEMDVMNDELIFAHTEEKKPTISLLARFDDICRGFDPNFWICDPEFLVFAQKQEENRKQWLAMENQIRDTQRALNEATKLTSKLELQVHHANGLLRDEIKGRIQAQQEKRKLDQKIASIADFLSTEDNPQWSNKDKLIDHLRKRRQTDPLEPMITNDKKIDFKMDTISEAATLESRMAAMNDMSRQSDEELELSGLVRSYRELHGAKIPAEAKTSTQQSARKWNANNQVEPSEQQRIVATTKIVMSPEGPITATSVIESFPGGEVASAGPVGILRNRNQSHILKKLPFVRSIVNCSSCGNRIRLGKPANKCGQCGGLCHVDCISDFMQRNCQPKDCTTPTKNKEAIKSSSPLRFFPSPSFK